MPTTPTPDGDEEAVKRACALFVLGVLHSFSSPILSALYERLLQRDCDVSFDTIERAERGSRSGVYWPFEEA